MTDLMYVIRLNTRGNLDVMHRFIDTNDITNEIHQTLTDGKTQSIIGLWDHIRSQGGILCLPEEG